MSRTPEFADPIGLVCWCFCDLGASTNDLSMISVDVLDPLEQVDAAWISLISNKVNRGVIPPHYRVCLVAEVPCEPQDITIERCCRFDVFDMQDWCTLNKLCRIGRW